MSKKFFLFPSFVCIAVLVLSLAVSDAGTTKGAKAIFDSGEGPSVGMSVGHAPKRTPVEAAVQPVKKEKYTGISYQLLLLSDDGQMKAVSKSRPFRSGERMKMLVRTNRPGYLTIFNIGSSGKTNLLFNEYVEAFTMQEVPRNTNFMFVGAPGTETVLVMLSDAPNPMAGQTTTASTPSAPPEDFVPPSSDAASLPPPPPAPDMVASIEGSKRIKGSKDIVVEDSMQNSYTVISPRNGWKPVKGGMKDIVLESSTGSNYGVIPASAIADGGILTLEIKLRHK